MKKTIIEYQTVNYEALPTKHSQNHPNIKTKAADDRYHPLLFILLLSYLSNA